MLCMCDCSRNNYSSRLEEDPFPSGGGPTADYAFMLFFGAVVLWVRVFGCLYRESTAVLCLLTAMDACISLLQVIAFFMGLPFLGSSLIFMIVYVWSRRNPTMPVAIWGNDHDRVSIMLPLCSNRIDSCLRGCVFLEQASSSRACTCRGRSSPSRCSWAATR